MDKAWPRPGLSLAFGSSRYLSSEGNGTKDGDRASGNCSIQREQRVPATKSQHDEAPQTEKTSG